MPDNLRDIIKNMNIIDGEFEITPFKSAEDGEDYEVWRVDACDKTFVLKKAKGYEFDIYTRLLYDAGEAVPRVYATAHDGGCDYILMQYIPGDIPLRLDRSNLTAILDAMISMQDKFWGAKEPDGLIYNFERSLERRIDRGRYLNDTGLESLYEKYIECYKRLPRTLFHDDLLPFNAIVSGDRAVLIDWEIAGVLPYPTSLARLISHAFEDENSLFFITDEDKRFAVDYYYDRFISEKGISRADYLATLRLFCFYEYCEWIMVGNKYGSTESELYKKYLSLAKSI